MSVLQVRSGSFGVELVADLLGPEPPALPVGRCPHVGCNVSGWLYVVEHEIPLRATSGRLQIAPEIHLQQCTSVQE